MRLLDTKLIKDSSLVLYLPALITATDQICLNSYMTPAGTITTDSNGKYDKGISATWSPTNKIWSTNFGFTPSTGNFSMGCWFKKSSAPTNDFTPTLMAIGTTGSPRAYIVISKTNGYAFFYFYDGSYIQVTSTKAVCDNAWHHIVGVRDGTSHLLYVDGIVVGSQTATAKNITGTTFIVGGVNDGTYDNLGAAVLDDLFVFSRALSEREIVQLVTDATENKLQRYRRSRFPGSITGIK